jgi:glycosyltransferase involved in cell wall biosynthesis
MNVLLVGIHNKIFLVDLRNHLIQQGFNVDLIDPQNGFMQKSGGDFLYFGKEQKSTGFLKKNYLLWRNFLQARKIFKNSSKYDICNIHFLDIRYFFFKKFLKRIAHKLIVSTYGTDFYKYRKYSFLQKPFYRAASRITFSNEATRTQFNKFYQDQYSGKTAICTFGLSKISTIQKIKEEEAITDIKKLFNIPDGKTAITVGYHANPITQQLKILACIQDLPSEIREQIHILFPLTYGGTSAYMDEIENYTKSIGVSYTMIKGFRSDDEISRLRLASDVMINLPKSDQLSATMMEYLLAGNYVITGQWLPYQAIDDLGVRYKRIQSFEELTPLLCQILTKPDISEEELLKNARLIWNFISWDIAIQQWLNVYKA